jgi:hypothetical protein
MTDLAVIKHPSGTPLPALIAGAGKPAARRFLEFFTVNIRNRNTQAAYARANIEAGEPCALLDSSDVDCAVRVAVPSHGAKAFRCHAV